MREVLFRGKRVINDDWVDGSLLVCNLNNAYGPQIMWYTEYGLESVDVIPETVGQYTGEVDKNGKMIFEGDIVTMQSYSRGKHKGKHKAVVYFERGKFAVDGSNYCFKDIAPGTYEVIGNIYDNPELLNT